MYTERNFKTKKELKAAVDSGKPVYVQPDRIGGAPDGKVYLSGPHFPKPHSWYASCQIVSRQIVKGTVK